MEPGQLNEREGLIYLNNAATSWPKPPGVIAEVTKSLQDPYFEQGRTTASGAIDYPAAARETLARFFHAEKPGHIIFTQNATDSLNLLIHGFTRNTTAPFHTITTELEHNSVLRPLHALEMNGALSLTTVPFTNNHVSLAAIKAAIREDTRLVVMTHGSNVLGSVQDIKPVAEYLRTNDIFFIVDGAQTAGHIPIDLSCVPVDAFVFTGHKALFSIPGIGGFYLPDPTAIAVTKQGGTGSDSGSLRQPMEMPTRFESGTHNYPGIASLYAGVRFIEGVGLATIERKGRELTASFVQALKKTDTIIIHNKSPDLPIVSFSIDGIDNSEVGFILARAYQVITRTGLHCAPLIHRRIDGGRGCIRASFSWFTTMEECRVATGAIREVAESAHP
ncbi:MAG: aminotransferase class V-fold PLP-dependent enzyme [Methanomicrobiales archaeon]|nr:aminotransferase class V-fold PLP-dependent enzyme [Methanomicrobiales archaeon]